MEASPSPSRLSQAMGLPVLHVFYEDLAGRAANLEEIAGFAQGLPRVCPGFAQGLIRGPTHCAIFGNLM